MRIDLKAKLYVYIAIFLIPLITYFTTRFDALDNPRVTLDAILPFAVDTVVEIRLVPTDVVTLYQSIYALGFVFF